MGFKGGKANDFLSFFGANFRGQVTIFIIIAVFVVAGGLLIFYLRQGSLQSGISPDFEPAYKNFLNCIEENTNSGIDILESQGGYIEIPEFSPGSSYMPFSSQLDFLGNPIPYWYYVSGNNIPNEQVPLKSDMESQLGQFIDGKIRGCKFDNYYSQGFQISIGEPDSDVTINEDSVEVTVNSDLSISRGNESVFADRHEISINSEIGALYDSAKKIYDYEQASLFLEDYGLDTLRLYAPVDGVELRCSPLTWDANEIFNDLSGAIEANTLALDTKSGIFSATGKDKYFLADISVPHDVRFLNSRNWSSSFEVNPSDESFLISSPVGTQPDLGALGFCYVPYHFVYNVKYPVLVQVLGNAETFQFPLAVVIQGNNPRESLDADVVNVEIPQLCSQKNARIEVDVFDSKSNAIDADVSYECFGTKCEIGKTSSGKINEFFPQCANGFVVAKSEGFATSRTLFSTVGGERISVFLDKIYKIDVELKLDERDYNGQAIISFNSENGDSKTIVYPDQRTVELSQGQYEIQVNMHLNSTLSIGATSTEKCVEVPQEGLGGFFGFSKEKCFKIEFPPQVVSSALSGGGRQNYYALESELSKSNTLEINAGSLPKPNSIKQLQENYILLDEKGLKVTFK